jgi:N-acyl-D-amino-acid deacylase
VLVNGAVALSNGRATGVRSGRALLRSGNMPSRPMTFGARRLEVKGVAAGARVSIDLMQQAGTRQAAGTFTVDAPVKTRSMKANVLGVLQSTDGWSSFTGVAAFDDGNERAFTAIVDQRDPASAGSATIAVMVDGETLWRGTMPLQ